MTGAIIPPARARACIIRILTKKHGLTLRKEAIDYLLEVLAVSAVALDDLPQTLDYIAQAFINHQGVLCVCLRGVPALPRSYSSRCEWEM
jgi:hypothetical protein